jgi:hypothetical protein
MGLTLKQRSETDYVQKIGASLPEQLVFVELLDGIDDGLRCLCADVIGPIVQDGITRNGLHNHRLGSRSNIACIE